MPNSLVPWLPVIHAAAGALVAIAIMAIARFAWVLLSSDHQEDRRLGAGFMTASLAACACVFWLSYQGIR